MTKFYGYVLSTLFMAGTMLSGAAQAGTISGFINTDAAHSQNNGSIDGTTYYSNGNYSGPFPASAVTIGEFDFTIPASEIITAATISGNFGSNIYGSTAAVDLFANGVAIAGCDENCSFNTGNADVAWSYTFNSAQLNSLLSNGIVLTAVQQSAYQIVLDPTSITITTAPVPLPSAVWLLGSGVLSLLGRRQSIRARA